MNEAYLGHINAEDPKLKGRFLSFLRGNRKPKPDGAEGELPESAISRDLLLPNTHLLTDVLPHNLSEPNPNSTTDILEIMRWTKNPEVAGHVYQLEGGDQDLYRGDRRKSMYVDYYQGWKDDEARPTKPEDSIFLKGINLYDSMIANTRIRTDGVYFIRNPHVAEWERQLVVPEHLGKKIGLGFSLYAMDTVLFRYRYPDGEPTEEVRASVYIDVAAGRNLDFLHMLGYETHGPSKRVNGRWIQPFRLFPDKYAKIRPRAIDHLGAEQPQWAERLLKEGEELQIKK